jgi:hypothetical protein
MGRTLIEMSNTCPTLFHNNARREATYLIGNTDGN